VFRERVRDPLPVGKHQDTARVQEKRFGTHHSILQAPF
jgi:hypothetical protein